MVWRQNASFGNVNVTKSLSVQGAPISPSRDLFFGNHWFLHSGTGTDGGGKSGKTKDEPLATLDNALGKMKANNDDVLHIMPGHSETITGAGGITLDMAGSTIIGHGRYDRRPTFLIDGAAASMLVTAANVSLENCVFNSGHADLAYLALVTAKGFRFANNFVGENVATENFVTVINIGSADNDADGIEVVCNNFVGVDTAATGSIVFNKNINDASVLGNFILGNFGTTPFAPIYMPDNEIPLNMEIAYNVIHNQHNADAAVGVSVLEAVGTGMVHHNICYALDVAGATPFLTGATGLSCFENYYSFEGNNSGYLMPTMGTAA